MIWKLGLYKIEHPTQFHFLEPILETLNIFSGHNFLEGVKILLPRNSVHKKLPQHQPLKELLASACSKK